MNTQEKATVSHNVMMRDRESLSVSGVCDIISFDESGVVLETVMGVMAVDGSDLHVSRFDTDRKEVDLTGKVNGLVYAEKRGRRLFGRS
jgi:sporulation protein YabP